MPQDNYAHAPQLLSPCSAARDRPTGRCRPSTAINKERQLQKEVSETRMYLKISEALWFLDGSVVRNLPAKAGDTGSIPDLGKIPHPTGN